MGEMLGKLMVESDGVGDVSQAPTRHFENPVEEVDVVVFSRYDDHMEKKVADNLISKLKEKFKEKYKCELVTPEHHRQDFLNMVSKSKHYIYMIGEKFILDNVGEEALHYKPAELERTHIISKKEKDKIKHQIGIEEQETKKFHQGIKLALDSVKSWEVYDDTDSDEATEKLIVKLAGGIQRDGVKEHSAIAMFRWKEKLIIETTNRPGDTTMDEKLGISAQLLYDHLNKFSYKWPLLGRSLGFSQDQLDKIRAYTTEVDNIINYCYVTVLEKWLTGEKEVLSKEVLVEALKLGGNPLLAANIANDSSFDLTMPYLSKKLRPLKYCYKEYGLLLGLDLPDYTHLEKIRHDIPGLYMTMVIMLWFEKTGENCPSKKSLNKALLGINVPELAMEEDK